MRRIGVLLGAGVLFIVFSGTAPAAYRQASRGAEVQPAVSFAELQNVRSFSGRLIARPVQPEDWLGRGVPAAEVPQRVQAARTAVANFAVRDYVPQTDEYVFNLPAGRTENDVAAELLASGNFEYVEPDWIVWPADCPNDPKLPMQWHHGATKMDSCAGWSIHTGDPVVGVGICDTGIRKTHEDLLLHRREGYNAVDRIWESAGGKINPVNPHGTLTTGCAAANGDNGKGGVGVGWNLSHRMLRVSNNPEGTAAMSDLTHAARTAIEAGDKVASVSYSGVDSSWSIKTTATYIKSIGGLLIWSAGNDGRKLTINDRDADNLIVVGATNSKDEKADFSAWGRFVDLMAPGVNIYSTDSSSDSAYDSVSGTSFSAPLVAGLVALMWSQEPGLTPNELEDLLKAGCDDLGSAGLDDLYGYGRINVHQTLALVPHALKFEYPDGQPALVDPDGGTTLRVEVLPDGEQPQAGTAKLHYSTGTDSWIAVPMQPVTPNVYDAVFPAFECGAPVSYYVSAKSTAGTEQNDPPNAPAVHFSTQAGLGVITVAQDDFETDTGWTVAGAAFSGAWERGVPAGKGDRGDPVQDFDSSGQCWVTGLAELVDLDSGPTRLLSPVFKLSQTTDPQLRYARWFTNDPVDGDWFAAEISPDAGQTWKLLEKIGDAQGWLERQWRIADYVALTDQVQVRFSAADLGDASITEAGVDAFAITDLNCGQIIVGDLNCDGVIDAFDIDPFVLALTDPATYAAKYPDCAAAAADVSGDGHVDAFDIDPFVKLLTGG